MWAIYVCFIYSVVDYRSLKVQRVAIPKDGQFSFRKMQHHFKWRNIIWQGKH